MNVKVGTFTGVVIYHYDFKNKEGKSIKTTKCLFNVNGTAIFVNSPKLNDKEVGSKVIVDLSYDGKNFVLL